MAFAAPTRNLHRRAGAGSRGPPPRNPPDAGERVRALSTRIRRSTIKLRISASVRGDNAATVGSGPTAALGNDARAESNQATESRISTTHMRATMSPNPTPSRTRSSSGKDHPQPNYRRCICCALYHERISFFQPFGPPGLWKTCNECLQDQQSVLAPDPETAWHLPLYWDNIYHESMGGMLETGEGVKRGSQGEAALKLDVPRNGPYEMGLRFPPTPPQQRAEVDQQGFEVETNSSKQYKRCIACTLYYPMASFLQPYGPPGEWKTCRKCLERRWRGSETWDSYYHPSLWREAMGDDYIEGVEEFAKVDYVLTDDEITIEPVERKGPVPKSREREGAPKKEKKRALQVGTRELNSLLGAEYKNISGGRISAIANADNPQIQGVGQDACQRIPLPPSVDRQSPVPKCREREPRTPMKKKRPAFQVGPKELNSLLGLSGGRKRKKPLAIANVGNPQSQTAGQDAGQFTRLPPSVERKSPVPTDDGIAMGPVGSKSLVPKSREREQGAPPPQKKRVGSKELNSLLELSGAGYESVSGRRRKMPLAIANVGNPQSRTVGQDAGQLTRLPPFVERKSPVPTDDGIVMGSVGSKSLVPKSREREQGAHPPPKKKWVGSKELKSLLELSGAGYESVSGGRRKTIANTDSPQIQRPGRGADPCERGIVPPQGWPAAAPIATGVAGAFDTGSASDMSTTLSVSSLDWYDDAVVSADE